MSTKRILIIDDDPDLVLANRLVLESAGYVVDEAHTGEEGLAKMRETPPDLVLMDVMMATPLDGYYATQQIADDPQLRNIPVIMLSSIASSQHAATFPTNAYLNVVEFIAKPIEPEKLLSKVRRYIR